MIKDVLQNPSFVTFGPPFLLLVLGVLAKRITTNKPWRDPSLYFLGVESSTAALTSAIIYLGELAQKSNQPDWERVLGMAGFILISLIVFVFVLSLHQQWETQTGPGRFVALAVVANLLGSGLLLGFLSVKGIESKENRQNPGANSVSEGRKP